MPQLNDSVVVDVVVAAVDICASAVVSRLSEVESEAATSSAGKIDCANRRSVSSIESTSMKWKSLTRSTG